MPPSFITGIFNYHHSGLKILKSLKIRVVFQVTFQFLKWIVRLAHRISLPLSIRNFLTQNVNKQEIEIQLSIQQEEMILFVDILRQKVTDGKGKTYAVGQPNDPFQELEGDFENDSDFEGFDDF